MRGAQEFLAIVEREERRLAEGLFAADPGALPGSADGLPLP